MATQEVSVPFTVDDFEPDDIVWRQYFMENIFLFGRVTHTDEDTVYASCEDGILYTVPVGAFGQRSKKNEIWGKLLDISQVKTGSRLSSKGGNERVFWEVVEFQNCRPGVSGHFKMVSEKGAQSKTWEKTFGNIQALKMLMIGLVMEG